MPKPRVRNTTPAAGSGPLAIHLERRAARAEAELRTWRDKYKHAIRELEDADHRLDIALGLDGKQRPQIPKVRASTTKKQTEGVIVAVCSDWHVGELVNPRAINGLNKYDPNIARDSIRAMTDGFLEKLADIRHGTTVNSMVLALLGDLMTGYIHEELVESNTMSPTEEMDFLQDELCLMIERLWGTGKLRELVIPCMYGNHGRTTTKKRILTGAKNSFEWFVYRTIAKVFRNEPKIRFEIGDGDQVYVDVFDNYRIRCIHGDQVTYNGGQGGITVPLKKKVDKWDKGIRANVTLLGHFHTFVDYQYAVINGSLIGYNSFAQHLGFEYEPPQQGLLLIDKEQNRKVVLGLSRLDNMPGRRKPNDPKGNLERNELDAAVQRIVEDIRRVYLTIGQELSSDILNDKVRRILDEEGGIMYRFIVTRLAEALGLKAVEETSQDDGDD